ncbi:somatostatin receptor type 4-like [Paramacrobiotus metropolitanus]|uniref:somatostatin receptor type 4-like n=1 Tax=Paramacrobiotus metropolitanus TaxID=2943436 RepID=UPI00244580D1|nr:somatostatin receptor type 4-like [Paramacrobiotus metropolitanus]
MYTMPLNPEPTMRASPSSVYDYQHACMNDSIFATSASPAVLYTVNAINAIICLVGLSGNILVFYVVCRFSAMRTVTNVFILMLAMADIAFLVNIPFLMTTSILEHWPFGNIYCKIYYSMSTVNQFASSFFLVTMSADRYVAICLPIRSRQIRTTRTAVFVCSLVWALAIMLMYPVFLYAETDSAADGSVTHCNIFWPDSFHVSGNHAFVLYCFVLGYAFPVAFMLTFYGLVVQRLRSRHNSHDHPSSTSSIVYPPNPTVTKRRTRLRRVTVMIFVVIVVYLLCWTPYWGSQLFISFSASSQFNHLLSCPLTPAEIRASQRIVYLSLILQCLCFANSAVNPILYAILSENFKQSYAKACYRCTKNKSDALSTPNLMLPRESSYRPEYCSNYKLSQNFSPPEYDKRPNLYLSCNMQHSPMPSTPNTGSTNCGPTTSVAPVKTDVNRVEHDSDEDTSVDMQVIKGEVIASFQITAWTPLMRYQEPMVTRKTVMTTFELMSPESTGSNMLL